MAGFKQLEVDLEVWKAIVQRMSDFDEHPNEVLRRVLGLSPAKGRFEVAAVGVDLGSDVARPMSFLEAAIKILTRAGKPLHYLEISDIAKKEGMIRTSGKTPHQTMSATLSTNSKGLGSHFVALGKGYYQLRVENNKRPEPNDIHGFGFIHLNTQRICSSAREVLIEVFERLSSRNTEFMAKFVSLPKHGRSRRFAASTQDELYPGRPDLGREHSYQLTNGYWIGTNYSRAQIRQILQLACEIAGLKWGEELVVYLGD